jgi:hypothetical protein
MLNRLCIRLKIEYINESLFDISIINAIIYGTRLIKQMPAILPKKPFIDAPTCLTFLKV